MQLVCRLKIIQEICDRNIVGYLIARNVNVIIQVFQVCQVRLCVPCLCKF